MPFRAAHTPSERSEYAQPDHALLLTQLAYYDDGLSPQELLQALRRLLSLGPTAQRFHYEEWLALVAADSGVIPEELDEVSKIDISNQRQMHDAHRLLSHNMGAVDFWLNTCVFPLEMQQFPQRLPSSSWHVAQNDGGQVVGFSGTVDNSRLLPLQVRWQPCHVLRRRRDASPGNMFVLIAKAC